MKLTFVGLLFLLVIGAPNAPTPQRMLGQMQVQDGAQVHTKKPKSRFSRLYSGVKHKVIRKNKKEKSVLVSDNSPAERKTYQNTVANFATENAAKISKTPSQNSPISSSYNFALPSQKIHPADRIYTNDEADRRVVISPPRASSPNGRTYSVYQPSVSGHSSGAYPMQRASSPGPLQARNSSPHRQPHQSRGYSPVSSSRENHVNIADVEGDDRTCISETRSFRPIDVPKISTRASSPHRSVSPHSTYQPLYVQTVAPPSYHQERYPTSSSPHGISPTSRHQNVLISELPQGAAVRPTSPLKKKGIFPWIKRRFTSEDKTSIPPPARPPTPPAKNPAANVLIGPSVPATSTPKSKGWFSWFGKDTNSKGANDADKSKDAKVSTGGADPKSEEPGFFKRMWTAITNFFSCKFTRLCIFLDKPLSALQKFQMYLFKRDVKNEVVQNKREIKERTEAFEQAKAFELKIAKEYLESIKAINRKFG